MASVNLLSTTPDGQQVYLTTATGQPILTSSSHPDASLPASFVFAEGSSKPIILQNDQVNQGIEYTIIEDPNPVVNNDPGGYLQATSGAHVQAGSIVFSQDDLYDVLNNVTLQSDTVANNVVPTVEHHSIHEESKPGLVFKRPEPRVEKPIGRGPFTCDLCPNEKPFTTWRKYKRHQRNHDNDKRFKCSQCPSSYNFEKNLR